MFQEELPIREVRERFESLLEITSCAICLETVRPDMVQCVNGHIFCSECIDNITICPTCQNDFSKVKPPPLISEVVRAMPPRCKHKNCGKYLKPDDDHEQFCGWRIVSCKVTECEWAGPGQDLLGHIQQQHPHEEILSENSKVYLDSIDKNTNITVFKPLVANGYFFWYEIRNSTDERMLFHSFYFIPNGRGKQKLSLKIKSFGVVAKFMSKIFLELSPDASGNDFNYICVPNFILPHLVFENEKALIFQLSVKTVQ